MFKSEGLIKFLIYAGTSTLFVALVIFFWQERAFDTSLQINSEKIAQFGDFIGGISGSIWALAGVLLFYKALSEQRQDFANNKRSLDLQAQALLEQIEEVKLNRKELESTRKVYVEQSKTIRIQQFESNFYSLLDIHLKIKSKLSEDDLFRTINSEIIKSVTAVNIDQLHDSIISKYLTQYDNSRELLSHYFRSLYRLFSIIENNDFFDSPARFFYFKIVRAQLSDFEIILLYYNSLTKKGKKMQNYVLKYNLLKHLQIKDTSYLCSTAVEGESIIRSEIADHLFSHFDDFLKAHFEKFYDIEFEKDKIEESFSDTNVIISLHVDGDGKRVFKIESRKGSPCILENYKDESIKQTLYVYFCFRLKFSQYLKDSDISVTPSITDYDDRKIYVIEIVTNKLIRITRDEV